MRNNVLYKFVFGTGGQKQRLIVKISEKLIFTNFSKEKNNRFFPSQPLGAAKGAPREVVCWTPHSYRNDMLQKSQEFRALPYGHVPGTLALKFTLF